MRAYSSDFILSRKGGGYMKTNCKGGDSMSKNIKCEKCEGAEDEKLDVKGLNEIIKMIKAGK